MNEIDTWLLSWIVKWQNIAYLLLDYELRVVSYSATVYDWLEDDPMDLTGQLLSEILPEMVGAEDAINNLSSLPDGLFAIPKICRLTPKGESRYFDLHIFQVEPYETYCARYLVLITDVTTQTLQMQQVQQQRNELSLLSAQLHTANEQIAYLLKHFVPQAVAECLIRESHLPPPGGEG